VEKIRILYAEGYDLVLLTAKQRLEAEGWEVEVCRSGAAALKKLGGSERYDLLIFDDRLDDLSAADLVERARLTGRLPAAPVILFTARHVNGDPPPHWAAACLGKPAGLKELVETCRRLLPQAEAPQGSEVLGGEPQEVAD
jgi:DNA-binding response OmpR family regulator